MRRTQRLLFVLCCICGLFALSASPLNADSTALHTRTEWAIRPSLKYDALCLLNVLSGDPYYLHYYQSEYDHFHPLFTPEENQAFSQLKHVIKDEGEGIVSAKLALYFSVVDDETLPELIHTAHDSGNMRIALKKTSYWDEDGWKNYEKARPALEIALRALNRVGFPAYWEQSAKPGVERRIAELSPDLPKYNIVPVIEQYLGFALPSKTITVYLLAYSEPHGIRVTGLRFLTHESYPLRIVLQNAIHEPMHPPYDAKDPRIRRAIDLLSKDPLVADKVKHHDPSFGYNTTEGYIEEDSVEALDQIVSEQVGGTRDAHDYFKDHDGGMHVLAAAIYTQYKAAVARAPETYSHWFVHAVEDGELRGNKLQVTIDTFFSRTPSR
jgi:hypothetical protein